MRPLRLLGREGRSLRCSWKSVWLKHRGRATASDGEWLLISVALGGRLCVLEAGSGRSRWQARLARQEWGRLPAGSPLLPELGLGQLA